MKNELTKQNDKPVDDMIVIADECGDTLWDAVLEQDDKLMKRNVPLFSNVDKVQECDPEFRKLVGAGATENK